ncbi:hypothetical protein GSI_05287 [Ganoderma sinense ZZ0214-1]|uniref:Uncharacterized protein n=1 Tax=Ganoderma sinense ZZ0214-1 TaxID=1077348 RepID=A0A2G8SFN4_9APHY|nr:hypothetical protein GSI_05287 [Ganoderma sinense ZZ0214-1]
MFFVISIYALLEAGPAFRHSSSDIDVVIMVALVVDAPAATGRFANSGEMFASRGDVAGTTVFIAVVFAIRGPMANIPMEIDDPDTPMIDVSHDPAGPIEDDAMDISED